MTNLNSTAEEKTSQFYFRRPLKNFLDNINTLVSALGPMMESITKETAEVASACRKFQDNFGSTVTKENVKYISIPIIKSRSFKHLMDKLNSCQLSKKIVLQSFFVSFFCHYDSFLGMILSSMFSIKPETINSCERTISFKELSEFDCINDARCHIENKEIESILRNSHYEQLICLEKKFSITLTSDKELIKKFVELSERRNLFVHCNGVVSDQYLSICKKHDCDAGFLKGQQVDITQKYFFEAYECLYELTVKLTQVLWRKFYSQDIGKADDALIEISYDLIENNKLRLAVNILEFACSLKKYNSEVSRLMLEINRAQAYKWAGDKAHCMEILRSEDWPAKANQFQLANYVLTEQWDSAKDVMRRMGNAENVKAGYVNWPLYNEFRKRSEFLETYKEIFGEEFTSEAVNYDVIKKINIRENTVPTT